MKATTWHPNVEEDELPFGPAPSAEYWRELTEFLARGGRLLTAAEISELLAAERRAA